MTLRSLPAVGALLVLAAVTAGCGGDDGAKRASADPSVSSFSAPAATGLPGAPTPSAAPSSTDGAAPPPAPATAAPQGPTQRRPASPPPVVLPQRPAGAPGAAQVVTAFKAAGLKVPYTKDRSVDCGPDGLGLGCSEVVATGAVTVYVFPDETSAGDIAETWGGQSYRRGAVVLNYLEARTPAADRLRYEKVLNGLG
ncbi:MULTISPECIES: hypothetical protein [unclassified Micromonospora]|uniref:hypothetical protein n=1 Tax=unclassified Micromonospora TaxID=2617518 RepID=UPI002499EA5F|nr:MULTISPECIES: hypothetical protein [unclassified Micromonospora]WFE49707.1 hypothetical protein O7617_04940 [Micromonospora sp. WMMD1155]WFF03495.1 hypothetical protein O7616_12395 [Micromonospora sp. WMMD964]